MNQFLRCRSALVFAHYSGRAFWGTDVTSRALDCFTAALSISIFFEGPELLPSSGPRSPLSLLSCKPTKSVQELLRLQLDKQPACSGRRWGGGGVDVQLHGEMPGSSGQGRRGALAPISQRRQTPGLGSKAGARAGTWHLDCSTRRSQHRPRTSGHVAPWGKDWGLRREVGVQTEKGTARTRTPAATCPASP